MSGTVLGASLGVQMLRNLLAMQETQVQSLSREDPLEKGNGNPLQNSCREKFHGQRGLVGYSPWSRKELDRTETTQHARTGPSVCVYGHVCASV